MPENLDRQTIINLEKAIKELTRAMTTGSSVGAVGAGDEKTATLFEAERDAFTKSVLRGRKTISEYSHHLKELRKQSEKISRLELDGAADNAEELEVVRKKMRTTLDAMSDNFQEASGVVNSLKQQMNSTRQLSLANAESYHQAAYMASLLAKTLNDGTSAAVKNIRASSMLHASQIEQIETLQNGESVLEYREDVENALNVAIKNGAAEFAKQFGLLNEVTGELRDNLTLQELSDFRLALGEFNTAVAAAAESVDSLKAAGSLDLQSLLTAATSGTSEEISQATTALAHLATDLTAKGMMGDFIKSLENEFVAVPHVVEKIDSFGNSFATVEERMVPAIDALTETVINASGQQERILKRNTIEIQNILATNGSNVKLFGEKLLNLGKTIDSTRQQIDATTAYYGSAWGQMMSNIKGSTGNIKKFITGLSGYAAVTTYAAKAVQHFTKTYQEAVAFNVSQVAASFYDTSKMAWRLGMSFEDTTKFLKENGRLLAQVGPEGFKSGIESFKETFAQFGYNMQQGAELVGPAIEQGLYAGINTQNISELDKYMRKSMDSFQKISAIVDVTAKEYLQLNSQLLSSQGTFETLMGMDRERRKAFSDEIIARRDMYVKQGLTIQQAQELVKLQLEATKAPIKERAKNAAMAMARAQMAGLGAEQSMEVYRLRMKGRLTDAEQARLQELSRQTAVGVEQRKTQEYDATGGFFSVMDEAEYAGMQLSGAAGQAEKFGLQQQAALDAGKSLSDSQLQQAAVLARGNESVARFSQTVNEAMTILNTSWLQGMGASILSLGGLSASALMASKHLAGLGQKGLLKDLGGSLSDGMGGKKGSSATSKIGKIAKVGGSILGKLGPIASIGAIAYEGITSALDVEQKRKSGEITDREADIKQSGNAGMVAGSTAAGMIGAGIGQAVIPIPGVGALIGAIAGTTIGGWLGKKGGEIVASAVIPRDDATKPKAEPEIAPEIVPKIDPKIALTRVEPEIAPEIVPKIDPKIALTRVEPEIAPEIVPKIDPSKITTVISSESLKDALAIPQIKEMLQGQPAITAQDIMSKVPPIPSFPEIMAWPAKLSPTALGQNAANATGAEPTVNIAEDKKTGINWPELLKVTDEAANSKLATLVTHMEAAVEYLKNMSDATNKTKDSISTFRMAEQDILPQSRIATTNSFLTGRAF